MWTLSESFIFWLAVGIQILGLASVVSMHICQSGKRRAYCHRLFFATIMGLALVVVLSMGVSAGCWMSSGTMLSVMAVAATLDVGAGRNRQQAF
jgi:hypothetical protein